MNLLFCRRYTITALFLSGILNAGDVFKFRCPERSGKKLLSKQCPNPTQFHCLLNAADGLYTWECRNREWIIKGKYAVRRGLRHYIDYESCPLSRYQPFIYWSNEDHQCQKVKSLCSEDGQVPYDNGTATSDKGCRCDYIRGYDFLVPPKNECFCVPSEEDCSCLRKSFIDIHRQNADDNCIGLEIKETDIVFVTVHEKKDPNEPYNSTKQIYRFRNTIDIKSEGRFYFGIAVFLITVTIMFGLMIIISVAFCPLELLCQGQHKKHDTVISKIDFIKRGILSDIIILHSDEDYYNVTAIYKGHLRLIAFDFHYYDVTIESFKDVFPSTDKISLQEVIKHCKFLFFYVSGMSFPSKVAMYGLNEKEINSVLNLPQKQTKYPSIKTVCACEHSDINFSEIDLDYFNYHKNRESYRETFEMILKSRKK